MPAVSFTLLALVKSVKLHGSVFYRTGVTPSSSTLREKGMLCFFCCCDLDFDPVKIDPYLNWTYPLRPKETFYVEAWKLSYCIP